MQLEVFGKLTPALINERVITHAREKAEVMPVIIICSDLTNCKMFNTAIPNSVTFAGDDAGELVGLLNNLKTMRTGIVITTSEASKGADFVFAVPQAYVIHTALP